MSLESITKLNIDFYDKKYITINAKQYDNNSRFILATCYNHGELFPIYRDDHAAYIRYRKSDEYSVFNKCEINHKHQILIELTEQMLACDGICFADLVIVNKGKAQVDAEAGKIIAIDNASILSTMTFCIDVSETATESSEIESTYEFNLLNDGLKTYWADFEDVMKTSKSYAVGNSGLESRKDIENTDNAKYYYEQSLNNADNAKNSEDAASNSASAALISENNAKVSENASKASETNAANSASAALISEQKAKTSETAASTSELNAKTSETNTKTSENNAKASEIASKTSETNSAKSETNAKISETNAKTSEVKTSEYCIEVKNILDGLNSGFIPMGTISFSELATVSKAKGYVYNINEDFVTDDTFREGAGVSYTLGTNVYFTGDGKWDCFGGSASVTATVDEVKSYLSI